MRWLRRLGIVVLVVLVAAMAWEPSRVALQTSLLLPNLLGSGVTPLTWVTAAPTRVAVPYRTGADGGHGDLAELWLPAWASADQSAGAILLVLGVNNVGRNHPVVERVADGLARSGVAVLVPDSATLLEGRLEAGEIDGVIQAFETLAARPEVDPDRIGIAGFSVGGSLALLAGSDPRIADDVRWINAFGAYADAGTYLAAVSSHEHAVESGDPVAWEPSPLAREVYLRFVLDQVDDASDRQVLEAAFASSILAGERARPDDTLRNTLAGGAGRTAHDLLTAATLADATAAIDALPEASLEFIDALSPVRHLDGLGADVFLMHETTDHHVPVVESRALAAALGPTGLLRDHREFRLFDHVQPDDVDLVAAAPELLRLLAHVRTLMEETL